MPQDQLLLRDVFPTTAERIFDLWMDAEGHSRMTGSAATVDPRVGGEFSAWDGYITGVTETLEPGRRIVQRWRTTEFPTGADHSRVEVVLRPVDDGTELTLIHTEIPDGQGDRYEEGWVEYYFKPLRELLGCDAPSPEESTGNAVPARSASSVSSAPRANAAPKNVAAKKPTKRVAAKKPAKRASAKKAAPKKPAKRAAGKRSAAKKPATKKAAAKRPAKKKSSVKKAAAKRAPARRNAKSKRR